MSHVLINALSAHMIHINLNMIFYTHVEHSPTKTIYIKYYKQTNKEKEKRKRKKQTCEHSCNTALARLTDAWLSATNMAMCFWT